MGYHKIKKYSPQWDETRERFKAWWERAEIDRPMLRLIAKKKDAPALPNIYEKPQKPEELHLDVETKVGRFRHDMENYILMGESFPCLSFDLGPGSLATYIGSEPMFSWDTIWFSHVVEDWEFWGDLCFNAESYWWQKQLDMLKRGVALSNGEFFVNIPDLCEGIDVLASLRDPLKLCYDLVDSKELIKRHLESLNRIYSICYGQIYDEVKDTDNSSSFSSFVIWGEGKTAKIQCDFSALMSPDQFCEFVQPFIREQCARLDYTLYHLDGIDALKHLDAVLEIKELDALQWVPGAGKSGSENEEWDFIYEKAVMSGKSLWISIRDGRYPDWLKAAKRLSRKFGPSGLYFLFPPMSEEQAYGILKKAENKWR